MYVVVSGMMMLAYYGFPPSSLPDHFLSSYVRTTDSTDGSVAYYKLDGERPMTFSTSDDAQRVIDRFSIPDASPMPWRS